MEKYIAIGLSMMPLCYAVIANAAVEPFVVNEVTTIGNIGFAGVIGYILGKLLLNQIAKNDQTKDKIIASKEARIEKLETENSILRERLMKFLESNHASGS